MYRLAVFALTCAALSSAPQAAALPSQPLIDVTRTLMLELCIPDLSGGLSNGGRSDILRRFGAVTDEGAPAIAEHKHHLTTAEGVRVEIIITADRSQCMIRYASEERAGVDAVAESFSRLGWQRRAGAYGDVWSGDGLYAATAFAVEAGELQGVAYVVEPTSPLGQELAQWFKP